MLLDTTTKTITAQIEAAATTTNPVYSTTLATFAQPNPTGFIPSSNDGALNGTTPVTVVSSPASGSVTQVKELMFFNADTVQHTLTIIFDDNATLRGLAVIAVPTSGTLRYSDTGGWVLGVASAAVLAGASYQAQPANPTAPASTAAYKMQGLSGTITPKKSGTVDFSICGTIIAPAGTTVDNGIAYQLYYGTGGAPANAAATTGTAFGVIQTFTLSASATAFGDVHCPFSITAVVSGLTVGTAYWFDLAAESVTTASDMGFQNISMTATEF